MTDKKVATKLNEEMASGEYLQVSTISQSLIFVTRSKKRPGYLLFAFLVAQLIASVISAMADWKFAGIRSTGWGWTGVIWIYNIVTYMLVDPIKFSGRYGLSGKAWTQMFEQRIALTGRRDFGQEQRVAAWANEHRSVHGLENPLEAPGNSSRDLI